MKIFKRLIELKVKKLDAEQRIVYLANKLLQEVEDAGVSPRTTTTPDSHLAIDINVYRYGDDDNKLQVKTMRHSMFDGFHGKCTAKIKPL